MADTKISALPAVTTPAGTDEIPVNQAGTSKKLTLAQAQAMIGKIVGSVTADTAIPNGTTTGTDAALGTIAISANTVKAGDVLRLRAGGTVLNNSGGTVNFQYAVKIGSTQVSTGNLSQTTSANPRFWWWDLDFTIESLTAEAVNGIYCGATAGTTGATTALAAANSLIVCTDWTEDMSASKNLVVSAMNNSNTVASTQTVTLKSMTLSLLRS